MKFHLNPFVALTCCVIGFTFPTLVSGDSATDNDAEVVTFSVIGTIGVEIIIGVIAFFVWKKCKARKQKSSKANRNLHGLDNGAFAPNADPSAAEQGLGTYQKKKDDFPNAKAVHSPPHSASPNDKSWNSFPNVQFAGSNIARHGSYASLDNNINPQEPEIVSVDLRSQDFIGLGFNISGSMRDGIYISEVHNRGPAIESGVLKVGDRILSVTISFENMVFEDALTILSYASPYPVNICAQKHKVHLSSQKGVNSFETQLNHPLYRSQSLDALSTMRKETLPMRSISELKSDDMVGYGSLTKDIVGGSPRSRFHSTTNDLHGEAKLELPVSAQISEVIIHKPPEPRLQHEDAAPELSSLKNLENDPKNDSVKFRQPYKLHPSKGKDIAETLESTPNLGSTAKFPSFDSDDSISKLDEKMDIHFSNCDKEFEDLKQKADDDHFKLNLEVNADGDSCLNSPNSEKEFEQLENKIKFSDNFADIFDRFDEDSKFAGLDMSFDDFIIKDKEPYNNGVAGMADNSNKIFLTEDVSTELMTERNMDNLKRDDVASTTSINDDISYPPSGVPAIKIKAFSDWTSPKVCGPPSSTDFFTEEKHGLLTRPKRFRIEDHSREDPFQKPKAKPSTEEGDLDFSSSFSMIRDRTPTEATFDEPDSVKEIKLHLKDANENEPLSLAKNIQLPSTKDEAFLSGPRPVVEETVYSVNNLVQKTMPDILEERSFFKSSIAPPTANLDSLNSQFSTTVKDVDSDLLKANLNLKEVSSNLEKPNFPIGEEGLSFLKDNTKSGDVEATTLNPESGGASINSAVLLSEENSKNIDPFFKADTTESPISKYKVVTEETSISLWKQELDSDSTDTDSSEYEVKTDPIDISLVNTNHVNISAPKLDKLAMPSVNTQELSAPPSKADDLSLSSLKTSDFAHLNTDDLNAPLSKPYDLNISPPKTVDSSVTALKEDDLSLSSLKTGDFQVAHLNAENFSASFAKTDDLSLSPPKTVDLDIISPNAYDLNASPPDAIDMNVSSSKPDYLTNLNDPLLKTEDVAVNILKDGSNIPSLVAVDPNVPSLESNNIYVSPSSSDNFYIPPLKVRDFPVSFSEVDAFNVTPLKANEMTISPVKTDDFNLSPSADLSISLNSVDLDSPSSKADDLGVYPLDASDVSLTTSATSDLSLSPSKASDLSQSYSKIDDINISPQTSDLILSPSKTRDLIISPSKTSDLIISPSKASDLSSSPSKASDLSLSPSNSSDVSLSPLKSDLTLSPLKDGDLSLSPLKASVPYLNTGDVNDSSIKTGDFDISTLNKYDLGDSTLKTTELSASTLKVDHLKDSHFTGDDYSISSLKFKRVNIEPDDSAIFQLESKENGTLPTVLNSEINIDLPNLDSAMKTEIIVDKRPEAVNPNRIVREEKTQVFTEPIKLHFVSKTEDPPVSERSAPKRSTSQMPGLTTVEITEETIERKKMHRVTPYKYQFKNFDIKDISLDDEDSMSPSFTNIKQNLFTETRPEVDEETIYSVERKQKEKTFAAPVLKSDVALSRRSLDFAVEDGDTTDGKVANVSQANSNVPGKSSSGESSFDSESEEQKSEEIADPNERKSVYKMSLFKRNRSETLTSSSSLDSDEDGATSKNNLTEGLLSQPLKTELDHDERGSSFAPSIHEYKMRILSLEIDRLQSDLNARGGTPRATLTSPKEDEGEEEEEDGEDEDEEEEEEEENQDKKDEAFFEMTEDEFSTDTQSLSPKSVVTRAISCDGGFVTSDDSDPAKPRTDSLKQETKDPADEDNYIDWSGKSLVRSDSFSRVEESKLVWTESSHTKDDKRKSDSDSNSDSGRVAISEPSVSYKPTDNLSLSCSSSSISSTETKTNGERGNDSETSPEPAVDLLKFARPFPDESNHKADSLLLVGNREGEDQSNTRLVYEGHGALTLSFSAHSDTEA